MTEACQYLHATLSALPRLKRDDLSRVPPNGIYVVFEKGESAHGGERIVRVGTHTGQNNLATRIGEHLFMPNKDRSIFRKHVGRCLLARDGDPFLEQWEIDLTEKAARCANVGKIDEAKLDAVEELVSRYIQDSFSFVVFPVETEGERLRIEESLISTINHCRDCGPSESWLGRYHPFRKAVREAGLWNVHKLFGTVLSLDEARRTIGSCLGSAGVSETHTVSNRIVDLSSESRTGTSNVIRFPIQRAQRGSVYCKPLGIHFPLLYRTVQTVTAADLEAMGMANEEPVDGFVSYTLDPDQQYTGSVEREIVNRILDSISESLVIRFHPDQESAASYLTAVSDIHGSDTVDPVFETDDGLFTLTYRPTEETWPGPMVIYVADYQDETGLQQWQMATAPDGVTSETEYL